MKAVKIFLFLFLFGMIFFACDKSEDLPDNQTDNKILKFVLEEYDNIAVIDQDQREVSFSFGANAILDAVTPIIVTSEGAAIDPPSRQSINLVTPVEYVVTAADGTSGKYTVQGSISTDTALMVIDIQNGYFPFYNDDSLVCRSRRLIDKARSAGKKVIFIQTDYTSPTGGMDSPAGTWKFQIPDELAPGPDDIYAVKKVQNSFDETTGLVPILNEKRIGLVVICGIATQHCVHGTVSGGIRLGYQIIIAADAHSSYDPYAQDRIDKYNTEIWPALGCIIKDSGDIYFN